MTRRSGGGARYFALLSLPRLPIHYSFREVNPCFDTLSCADGSCYLLAKDNQPNIEVRKEVA